MRVYYHGTSNNHRIFVSPATDYPHVTAWREADGRVKQFEVVFANGSADLEDNLANYMIDKGLASATKIIVNPREVA